MYHVNGGRYEGQFKDDKCNGQGVYYFSNGDKYEGPWVNNVRTGQGIYCFANGDTYEGEFADNRFDGYGVVDYSSQGERYAGEWRKGKYNGSGTLYLNDGSKITAIWQDGEVFKGQKYNADGTTEELTKISESEGTNETEF